MDPKADRFYDRPPFPDHPPPASARSTATDPDDLDPESSASSPTSMGKSPDAAASSSALSPDPDPDHDPDHDLDASSPDVAARRPSSAKSSAASDKEKRKRSRVTPDQLVHLERFFSVDRSPTAARRREISELLGMQERQTQIWFQNRRAKAKLMDGKNKSRADIAPPNTPPELRPGYDASLHTLIHENDPVTIIPCSDLTIGTWRRIATSIAKHDLVAYVCDARRCLVWFIHSSGYGFKMEIPFDIIVDTEFTNAAPGMGLATFFLSQPPAFFLEDVPADGTRAWKRCADWTEGMQATKVLRHDLIGSAVQLAHVLRNFQVSGSADIRLREPAYGAVRAPELPDPAPEPQGYRAFATGEQQRGGGDMLGALLPRRRSSFAGQPLVLEAPPDHAGDYAVGVDPHPHQHSPTPPYQPFHASYAAAPLYPADIPDAPHNPPPHHHHPQMAEYARVYAPQGYGAPPASAPAAHGHFGGGGSPSPPLYAPHDMGAAMGIGTGGAPLLSAPAAVMHYDRALDDGRR